MAFPADILADGINIVSELTKGVQSVCTLKQYEGGSASGDETYSDPISILAVVDYTNKVTIRGGQILSISATLTIMEPVPFNLAVTDPPRKNPIDPRDKITLPDGTTGSIISVPGSVNNPLTGTGFIQIIEMGPRS